MNLNIGDLGVCYPSQRFPFYGRKGMVATSNALAAQAGLEMLKKGGNAVDAALAAAALPFLNQLPTVSAVTPLPLWLFKVSSTA